MSENDIKENPLWPSWRVNRLLKMLEYKAKGLTDAQVAAKPDMPSVATVSRELNSSQSKEIGKDMIKRATGMIWPMVERQITQIETDDLQPGQRISFRGKLIGILTSLVPKQIEQKIEATGDIAFILEAWRPELEEEAVEEITELEES